MTCYNPMIRVEDLTKNVKALDGHIYHPAKIFSQDSYNDLENVGKFSWRNNRTKEQIIPCGQCIGCRLDYSREWANRGFLESKLWEQNWFATLTYDDDHIVIEDYLEDRNGITWTNEGDWEGNLIPKDLQQFLKNIRQIMKREYDQDGIRFMACGEYGGETARPHYHVIFFNLNLPIEDLYHPRIINKEIYYQSHILERAWGKGICNISEASWNNIGYTARYITKKINGEGSEELYAANGKIKEFMRVSRMPGIGEGFYRKHWQEIYANDEIIIKNKAGIIKCKPPKYFDKLMEKEHPEEFKEIKAKRKFLAENQAKLKDQKTSIFRREQLKIEERSKEEQNLKLRRMMETGSQ